MNNIKLACISLFVLAAASANAQTASTSSQAGATSIDSSSSTAIGGGNATGGSVRGSGNSTTSNTLTSNGGASRSSSGVTSSGNSRVNVTVVAQTSTPTSGSGTGTTGSNPTGVANDATGPGSSPYNTANQDNVSYSGTQTIKTNPAIQAPGLTTTLSDTCMGSVSFGFSAPGFGATAGSTLVDQACVRRLDAREFRAMGLTDVALALLCQSDANRRAVESTGHLCPGTTSPLAKTKGEPSADATVSDDLKYRDPIVRQRMGLAPLDNQVAPAPKAVVQAAPPKVAVAPAPSPTIVTPPIAASDPVGIPLSENNQVMSMPIEDVAAKVTPLR